MGSWIGRLVLKIEWGYWIRECGVENGMGMLDQRVRCVVYRGYSVVAHEYVMIVRHIEHAHE